jgi:type IV pilus assembly protein PilE
MTYRNRLSLATKLPATPQTRRHRQARGFTSIELLIALVFVGLLLAVALPSYLDSVRKSRRAEGMAALTSVQQAQERFRANNMEYGTFAARPGPPAVPALPNSTALATSANGRYTITVTNASATGYTATATAVGAQANDRACVLMAVQAAGGNLRYGSGSSSIDWAAVSPDPGRCWAQ